MNPHVRGGLAFAVGAALGVVVGRPVFTSVNSAPAPAPGADRAGAEGAAHDRRSERRVSRSPTRWRQSCACA